jgi:hypothetical protein
MMTRSNRRHVLVIFVAIAIATVAAGFLGYQLVRALTVGLLREHSAFSAGSGSARWPQSWHQTGKRTWAAAALPSVIGGP